MRKFIPENYKWTALSVTSLGMLVGILNASTLIIALLTILAPAWGRLADIYGRKKLYVYGLAIFTIGSLLCGLSANIGQLIAFRVFQAIGICCRPDNRRLPYTDKLAAEFLV